MAESPLRLRLFVVSGQPASETARDRLERALREHDIPTEVLEVVDVLDRPDLAWKEKVLATPALIRLSPEPPLRLVGSLADLEILTRALGVR